MISVPDWAQEAYRSVARRGYGRFLAAEYRLALGDSLLELPEILASFKELRPDRHMGDGGTYRFRAYSRFRLDASSPGEQGRLTPLVGNSIYQELEDNPLNGGVERTYDPLSARVASGRLLQAMIQSDFAHVGCCEPSLREQPVVVGVHQVRIVARGKAEGLPTPEGIHRDRERFTFQHFMARHNVTGGEFRAYDQEKKLSFAWQQQDCLDTVMFEGTTWHSATPIAAADAGSEGYRDIFLIDFDRG